MSGPKQLQPLDDNQKKMLRKRGLDPKNYLVLRNTYAALWLRDIRDGSMKILDKKN